MSDNIKFDEIAKTISQIMDEGKNLEYLEFEKAALSGDLRTMQALVARGFDAKDLHSDFLCNLILRKQAAAIKYLLHLSYKPQDSFIYHLGISGSVDILKILMNYSLIHFSKED